ncbi:MAG TPA: glycosyltransferase family 9 protein [Opitutus sp.]|nr:glycosyltransferase family 9 protein [Opitutus sp.]
MVSRAKTLLIISPSTLAETVLGLQVSTTLKEQVEGLKISWIARDIYAPMVRACTAVSHVYVFDRKGGTKRFLRLLREVRKTKFDYVFDFQGLLRSGIMTSRAHGKTKVGRSDARELSGLFYDKKVPLPPDGKRSHALDVLLQFCPVLGAKPELRGELKFREADKLNLKFAEGRDGSQPIVMFPDSPKADKRWGGFKQLTGMILRQDPSRKIIWAGARPIANNGSYLPGQFLNLTGNTSLMSLPALIKRADWVISNDSGPMQLAAALGVQTLAIFGPTDPRFCGPYPLTASTHVVVQAPVGNLKLLPAREVFLRWQRARTRLAKAH